MKKNKLIVSMLIAILIFFSFTNIGYAATKESTQAEVTQTSKTEEANQEKRSEQIEETIDKDEGGLFEKVIAKIIRWVSISNI